MTSFSRREALATGLAASSVALAGCEPPKPQPMNILFILADDLGYADLSCFGRDDFETPNLDRLALEGMRLTNAYSNSAVCSPTRVALMTGNYQYRLPVGHHEPIAFQDVGLKPEEETLPKILSRAGYTTTLIGKWHLGQLPNFGPLKSGYHHFWGTRGGAVDYFRHTDRGRPDLWDGETRIEQVGYLTELLGDRTCDALDMAAQSPDPFFLSLHFSAPHWPWQGPNDAAESDYLEPLEQHNPFAALHYAGGSNKSYAAMVQSLDAQVGKILKRLKDLNLDKSTIVVFTSDNGGERFSKNWPFSGRKGELLEGGIRVPTIVKWPSVTKPHSVSDTPIMTMDWVPTLTSDLASKPASGAAFDGTDIGSVLRAEARPNRPLFWRHKHLSQKACRWGDWKYLEIAGNTFLFNIVEDTLERANLKTRLPDKFRELKSAWNGWNDKMPPIDPTAFSGGLGAEFYPDRHGSTTQLGASSSARE